MPSSRRITVSASWIFLTGQQSATSNDMGCTTRPTIMRGQNDSRLTPPQEPLRTKHPGPDMSLGRPIEATEYIVDKEDHSLGVYCTRQGLFSHPSVSSNSNCGHRVMNAPPCVFGLRSARCPWSRPGIGLPVEDPRNPHRVRTR